MAITKADAEWIDRLLNTKPETKDDCFGINDTITHTVRFGDGIEMDIKVCGVTYMEGESNLPWTEAVLFKDGHELCCSEPSDEFLGEWMLEYDGTQYMVEVVAE